MNIFHCPLIPPIARSIKPTFIAIFTVSEVTSYCYSSRSCHGNLVKGDTVSSGKAGCCMNGGVLSFKDKGNGICHECFSMYSV